jgi:hypothetical protein
MSTDIHNSVEQDQLEADIPKEQMSRRDFLVSLKKWSKAAVGAAVLASPLLKGKEAEAGSWINRRGGGYYYPRRGGSWANGHHGGWANRRGGLGWVNRY